MSEPQAGGVTVVIPTFNRESVLSRAIRSVLAQTRAPEEIIVVDDGSTDTTVDSVRAGFPEAVILTQENLGVSAARNHGIREASGEWIALLDSDDEWVAEKLERQLVELARHPDLRVCHTDEIWIRHHRRVNPKRRHAKYGGRIFQYCLPLCAMSPSSIVIHRSVFEDVGLFDEELPACEDYDLWLRICARYPVLYLDEPLVVKYGGHPDQLSRRVWGLDRFRIRALEKILQSNVLDSEDTEAALRILLDKIDIYIAGAEKREKWDEVELYRFKRRQWEESEVPGQVVDS